MICSCAAGEPDHPFSLSCDDADAIAASVATLTACENTEEGCEYVDENGIMTCRGAFFHLHYIHVWCSESTMTNEQDELVHDYEGSCPMCEIFRAYDASVPDCVQPTCDDVDTANAAAAVLVDAGCAHNGGDGTCCRNEAEIAAFRTVLAYHDMCDHDDVSQDVEMAKHDFGLACEAFSCNLVESDYAGDVCPACDPETEEAEVSCKQSNGCEACTDFHFGDDCAANGEEHCAEISCCPACESEIRAMFACEHGQACGTELTCGVACEEDTCPYDTTDDGMVGVDDLLGLLAAYGREC